MLHHSRNQNGLAAVGHDEYGFDSVSPYFSIHPEAEAFVTKVDWGNRFSIPHVAGICLLDLGQVTVPLDFLSRTGPSQLLRAVRLLRKRYGGEVAVIGKVIGPWMLAYHLHGVENLLLDTIFVDQIM
ncbi:uroporphyrinogen decarboxylase family protein [Anaerotruncus colihominis]|nr:uroporphyrinogen decarboxylase family protein [Anaerotruncus colihominis]